MLTNGGMRKQLVNHWRIRRVSWSRWTKYAETQAELEAQPPTAASRQEVHSVSFRTKGVWNGAPRERDVQISPAVLNRFCSHIRTHNTSSCIPYPVLSEPLHLVYLSSKMWATGASSFGDPGGFVPSSQPDGAAGTTEKKGRTTGKHIVPATIRQLLECREETLKVEDTDVGTLTVVGLVKSVEPTTTKVAFVLDDGTGAIEAVQYIGTDGDGGLNTATLLTEGMYGRVVGSLRTQGKGDSARKYIVIYKAMPVTDLNELTCHIMEVLQVPMKLRRLREAQSARINGAGMNNTVPSALVGNSFDIINGGGNGSMSVANNGAGGGFTGPQNMVLNIIRSCTNESGMNRADIIRSVKGSMNVKEVETVIDFLSGEGHIYSTIDDDHYRITDW